MTDINETTRKLLLKKEEWLNNSNEIERFVKYLEKKPNKSVNNYFELL